MLKKHFWKVVIAVIVILLAASFWYSKQATKGADEGVTVEAHFKGNTDAPVKLVEYSDFQCPACKQFYPYVKEIMEQHGNDMSLEYRHFPLINIHQHALVAARAAEAAGQQGKFWEMHDKLFENQDVWSRSVNPTSYFNQYAEELGLDLTQFKRQMNSSVIYDAIMANFNDARGRGFTGTPTFLLNGQEMSFTTFDEFRAQIEAAIAAGKTSEN